ncbi:sulfite exporter TauE/SafE family protein [Roseitranquillus sediminis]|uniref:sulfite exporter TauE/SafE family protein n=1 Tax=Roseitranquillus sediminis TaxID=2809051 RepID=UPI001D0CCDCA|nr:sulfite exporter TauE/SafE family protein [Roseitranquillus sediminis]MBM9593987.1 sulfite exporter TauE/SafE family protein [Roseitranquillus sediminis]
MGDDVSQLLTLAMALAVAGGITGVLAGLFGVGGGAIIVPVLYEAFRLTGVAEEIRMPLAVGTSLAIIVPTSIRSAYGHYRKGAVDMQVLRRWALPLVLGTVAGAALARYASPWVFQAVFVAVSSVIATKLLLGRASWRLADVMPGAPLLQIYGGGVGLASALMGIGGGAISTLVLTLHGRAIHQAVATSAGVGVLISIPGAIGYVIAGWGRPGLPPDAFGFVSLLGLAIIVPMTLLTTQIGVNLAHALPRRRLEVLFGLFLVTVCLRFVFAIAS